MKKVIMVLFFILSFNVYADEIVDIEELNTAEMIYEKVQLLQTKYPNLIKVEILGYSTDNRPIYSVILTKDASMTMRVNEGYVDKMHYLVESGIHSRENPGPNILLKQIELYAMDYYDDSVIESYQLNRILESNVIHFIPLSNPDGYNLSSRGLYTISKTNQEKLLSYTDQDFRNYKSNVNGVDLNRNFPGYYFDLELNKFRNIWNMIHNDFRSYRPSGSFYFGPYEASEIETNILMDYLLKYDFRNYLSFHSKGEIIYWNKWMLSEQHNNRTYNLAYQIALETDYDLGEGDRYSSSSGYLTDFTAMNTLKPSITIETVHWKQTLPVTSKYVKKAYEETKYIPLLAIKDGQTVGYFNYKWYVDGKYVRDFEEASYARAFLDEYGGKFLRYEGKPRVFLDDNLNKITRLELIHRVMTLVDNGVELGQAFDDCSDPIVLQAKALGIISGSDNKFRPDDYATYEETFVILSQAFFKDYELQMDYQVSIKPKWAVEALKVLLENNIIDYNRILVGRITLGELNGYLKIVEEIIYKGD